MDKKDTPSLQDFLIEHTDVLESCGYTVPIAHVSLEDIPDIVHAISLHVVILQSKAELDQVKDGLQELQVLENMIRCRDAFKGFFTIGPSGLSAGM